MQQSRSQFATAVAQLWAQLHVFESFHTLHKVNAVQKQPRSRIPGDAALIQECHATLELLRGITNDFLKYECCGQDEG